jgi:hypothetical protein
VQRATALSKKQQATQPPTQVSFVKENSMSSTYFCQEARHLSVVFATIKKPLTYLSVGSSFFFSPLGFSLLFKNSKRVLKIPRYWADSAIVNFHTVAESALSQFASLR